jgi:EAL domain-containing protein (putative c-di-GMP-specific phosphodiesterase class I)
MSAVVAAVPPAEGPSEQQLRHVVQPSPEAVHAVLKDPTQPSLVFQPIIDLRRGVVAGYEALARFTGPPTAPPDVWFAAAGRLGLDVRLEARVVRAVLAARETVPERSFLSVNVSPHLLCEPELADLLLGTADLSRMVFELTEHVPYDNHEEVTALLDRLRNAGAAVALDDAGSGYSGLRQLALVRPQIVKLDRALVDHADRDEAKLALAELLGAYASRLGARLLVEGVERPEELEAFVRLGVPLAQGWLFAKPGPPWTTLPPGMGPRLRAMAEQARQVAQVGSLLEVVPTIVEPAHDGGAAFFTADPGLDTVVVLDALSRPVQLLRRGAREGDSARAPQSVPVSLQVPASADLVEVATRAMTRSRSRRFDPIACVDEAGRFYGVVRAERMMLRLAELTSNSRLPETGRGEAPP